MSPPIDIPGPCTPRTSTASTLHLRPPAPWEVWYSEYWDCPSFWNSETGTMTWRFEDTGATMPLANSSTDVRWDYEGVVLPLSSSASSTSCGSSRHSTSSSGADSLALAPPGAELVLRSKPAPETESITVPGGRKLAKALFSEPATDSGQKRLTNSVVSDKHALSACLMAAYRAREGLREDALFRDPVAHILAAGTRIASDNTAQSCRTRFFDDLLDRTYEQSGIRQFIILGAGMDARPFRMSKMKDAHFFEVDKQEVFDIKEPLLKKHATSLMCAGRHVIPLDLSHNDNINRLGRLLKAKGFNPQQMSVWIMEGFIMYLSPQQARQLLSRISRSASAGSLICCDVCVMRWAYHWSAHVSGAQWLSGVEDYPFAESKFEIIEVINCGRLSAYEGGLAIRYAGVDWTHRNAESRPWIRDDRDLSEGGYGPSNGYKARAGYFVTAFRQAR